MNVSQANIEEIKQYLKTNGIESESLLIELTDHFSCEIEEKIAQGISYENAFQISKETYPPTRLHALEAERTYYLTTKSNINMLRAVFITGYISLVMMLLGSFFSELIIVYQFSITPYGLLGDGFLCFCFAFLPTLFIFFYRKALRWAKE